MTYRLYRDGLAVSLKALASQIEAGEVTLQELLLSTWEVSDVHKVFPWDDVDFSRETVRRLEDFDGLYYGDTDDMNALIDAIENLLAAKRHTKS